MQAVVLTTARRLSDALSDTRVQFGRNGFQTAGLHQRTSVSVRRTCGRWIHVVITRFINQTVREEERSGLIEFAASSLQP